jgi:hypothetical protein
VIPRLTGLTEAEAVHRLERFGLVAAIGRVPVDDKHLDGIVVDQIPIGDGTRVVDIGATVTIYVGAIDQGNGNSGDGNGNGGDGNGNGGDGKGRGNGGDGDGGTAAGLLPEALPQRAI